MKTSENKILLRKEIMTRLGKHASVNVVPPPRFRSCTTASGCSYKNF